MRESTASLMTAITKGHDRMTQTTPKSLSQQSLWLYTPRMILTLDAHASGAQPHQSSREIKDACERVVFFTEPVVSTPSYCNTGDIPLGWNVS